jgi:hypothetical protein
MPGLISSPLVELVNHFRRFEKPANYASVKPKAHSKVIILQRRPIYHIMLIVWITELSRSLTTMSNQYNDTLASHNDIDHASQIVELDTQKFRIAKAASDLEIEGERLEQELKGLRGRLQELELQGVEGDEQARASREVDDPTM